MKQFSNVVAALIVGATFWTALRDRIHAEPSPPPPADCKKCDCRDAWAVKYTGVMGHTEWFKIEGSTKTAYAQAHAPLYADPALCQSGKAWTYDTEKTLTLFTSDTFNAGCNYFNIPNETFETATGSVQDAKKKDYHFQCE